MEQGKNLYCRIFTALKETFDKKKSTYRDIRDLLAPGSGTFNDSDDELQAQRVKYQQLRDNEPASYLDTTTAGLYGGLINPAARWFGLTVGQTSGAYQNYDLYDIYKSVEYITEFLYYMFNRTNFYESMRTVFSEWVRYGIGCMLVEEDNENFIFFNPLTIGEYYLGVNAKGEYTKLARTLSLTADQMLDAFGDACPENVKACYQNGNHNQTFEVSHLICPNPKDGTVSDSFKYVDLYWMNQGGSTEPAFLRKSGFYSNPIVVFSWERKNLRTIYPIGIGEKILGDVRELQYTVKCLNLHKSYLAQPALALHTSLGKKPVLPGARFYTDQDPTKVASEIYRVASYIAEFEDSRARLLDKIRKQSYADILMLFAQQDKGTMTAREVTAIVNEQMTLMAPVYLQAKSGLETIFKRVLDICTRRRILKNADIISPKDLNVEFLSSIAKAQRMAEVGSIEDMLMYITQLAQLKPEALDYINEDAIVMDIAERLGNGAKINPSDVVAQIRQQRAEQQQAMMALEQRSQEMKIAKDASKAKLEPTNMLGQQVIAQGGSLPPESYPQNQEMNNAGR